MKYAIVIWTLGYLFSIFMAEQGRPLAASKGYTISTFWLMVYCLFLWPIIWVKVLKMKLQDK